MEIEFKCVYQTITNATGRTDSIDILSYTITSNRSLKSEEQLKAFIAKVQADASLQEQLKAEGADVVAIAKAAGFSITTEDLNSHSQDLSEKELESVAGGHHERCVYYTPTTKEING